MVRERFPLSPARALYLDQAGEHIGGEGLEAEIPERGHADRGARSRGL